MAKTTIDESVIGFQRCSYCRKRHKVTAIFQGLMCAYGYRCTATGRIHLITIKEANALRKKP